MKKDLKRDDSNSLSHSHTQNFKHNITTIYVFRNGMVVVFDQNGQQMPFFQGRQKEAMPKIKRRLAKQKSVVEWKIHEGANFAV